MYLKSLTLKGFKSFPDRTKLEFAPGISVVVGPNGSGKSNITDAVLWAMGEQSPLAVRGQSMQDVIFAGAHGVKGRTQAQVEVVIDNADGALGLPASEISILRRLDRGDGAEGDAAAKGEYRLNGSRCRLTDVLELLSDSGLGKEMHSVVSQGRVESIVTSRPRDRRLLIEEAAGLGKHRRRRRRAQLKLDRTEENLHRALDVEREARSRVRPLKRQAEAAELHARLERQATEARWSLAAEALRVARAEDATSATAASAARAAREQVSAQLAEVARRRGAAEAALAASGERRERIANAYYAARAAGERVSARGEAARRLATEAGERLPRRRERIAALEAQLAEGGDADGAERIAALEGELERIGEQARERLEREVAELECERSSAAGTAEAARARAGELLAARASSDEAVEAARAARREADRAVEAARREAARIGSELAQLNQLLRRHAAAPGGARSLADALDALPGYELAVAAVLDGRLGAALASDRASASALLDRAGRDGGTVLVMSEAERGAGPTGARPAVAAQPPDAIEAPPTAGVPAAADSDVPAPSGAGAPRASAGSAGRSSPAVAAAHASPPGHVASAAPVAGAVPLASVVHTDDREVAAAATALLVEAWVVDDLAALPADFDGIAVTRAGRVCRPGELRQAVAGDERVLEQRNRRDALVAQSEQAARAEQAARGAVEQAAERFAAAESARDEADRAAHAAARERQEAEDTERHAARRIAERREAPDEGALAVERARVEAELRAERRLAERLERERVEQRRRLAAERQAVAGEEALVPQAERLSAALQDAAEAIGARVESLEALRAADRSEDQRLSAELRACAAEEAEVQQTLARHGEAVTTAEVAAQRARDRAAEAKAELAGLARRLGLEAEPGTEPLDAEEAERLAQRIERLERRRSQLGPVNPLARQELEEALAHVEELERQREDLEGALHELRTLIRDTDQRIRESFEQTFEAAARNFEDVAAQLFPGGRGGLRLVREDAGPRPVLGGAEPADDASGTEAAADDEADAQEQGPGEELGVEIEITPAGKATKRLSLLSGGEKSLVALAFLFAVFLARPCPFYILDEVEAALDDLNIDRFLTLLRRYAERAQFIVVTHQKRTMEAADCLYGVSMAGDGVSKVVSRRLPAAA